jgi:hypothetical protein
VPTLALRLGKVTVWLEAPGGAAAAAAAPFRPGAAALAGCPRAVVLVEVWPAPPVTCLAGELVVVVFGCLGG